MEAIFGESSEEDFCPEGNVEKGPKDSEDSDSEFEEGAYHSDEENEVLQQLMNEGQPGLDQDELGSSDEDLPMADNHPADDEGTISEEPPENPGQIFGKALLTENSPSTIEDKMGNLPKSEIEMDSNNGTSHYVPPAMRQFYKLIFQTEKYCVGFTKL